MQNTTRRTVTERTTALALAITVTLALLGGIDRLAQHEGSVDALLARHQASSTTQG
jgi:hypothetical protein